MKKLFFFFFPGLCFFFPPQKLNEWMTCELFQEKKNTKKKTQILEKKNSNLRPKKKSYFHGLLQRRARKLLSKPIYRFFYIYTRLPLIIIDKKWFYTLISHFASFLEKNQLSITHFGMNGLWTFPGKKKTQVVFFFFRVFLWFRKKKPPISDLNEWMTNVHARGKKNTIPLCRYIFFK